MVYMILWKEWEEVRSKMVAWERRGETKKGQLGTHSEKGVSNHHRRKWLSIDMLICNHGKKYFLLGAELWLSGYI